MIYCKPVSIPYAPVLDTSIITSIQHPHVKFTVSQLNIDFIEYLKNLNLDISFVEVF
jgi:hypothetical protein